MMSRFNLEDWQRLSGTRARVINGNFHARSYPIPTQTLLSILRKRIGTLEQRTLQRALRHVTVTLVIKTAKHLLSRFLIHQVSLEFRRFITAC